MSRLRELFVKSIRQDLKKELGYSNIMQVPSLEKIVLNMGIGEASRDSKIVSKAMEELTVIAGQKPVITKARRSVAGFKIRQGMNIGVKVTLRKTQMYEFLDRLINIALPRVRDFRGVSSKSFDGTGNYSLGIKEQIVFPEIDYDKVDKVRGLDITVVTTAQTNEEGKALLKAFGFPFN